MVEWKENNPGGDFMLKIAIVDDDSLLCSALDRYWLAGCKALQMKQQVDVYYDGESFCRAWNNGDGYHLVFLDIELAEMNEVGVGHYIRERKNNNRMQIVFISGKRDYAMELFEIRNSSPKAPKHFASSDVL